MLTNPDPTMTYIDKNYSDITPESQPPSPLKWIPYLISSKTQQLTLWGHTVLAIGFLGAIAITNCAMLHYATQRQQEWLTHEEISPEDLQKRVDNVKATAAEKVRMVEQFEQILRRVTIHGNVMGLFYRLNFVGLGTICLVAGIASVSLFFISKHGWERINNAVISIFILSSGVVFFHGNLMLVMRYQDNITVNRQLFEQYSEMKNLVLSYWATQPTMPDSPSAAEFIHQIDKMLAEYSNITLDFDNRQAALLREPIDYFNSNSNSNSNFNSNSNNAAESSAIFNP